jgi:hypothetical protein
VERPTRVLIITDHTAATPDLLATIAERAQRSPSQFRLLIPNPARAEVHLLHPERHEKAMEAELVLVRSLPAFEEAAGGRVIASVSIRHDAYEAVEELALSEPVDEIILSVTQHEHHRWLHPDLPHRLARLGLPLTEVPGRG